MEPIRKTTPAGTYYPCPEWILKRVKKRYDWSAQPDEKINTCNVKPSGTVRVYGCIDH